MNRHSLLFSSIVLPVCTMTLCKYQVAIFLVIAMVLRRKPDVLVYILPNLRETPKYQGQDKLPLNAWLISQVTVDPFHVQCLAHVLCFFFFFFPENINSEQELRIVPGFCWRSCCGVIHVGSFSLAHAE